MTKQEQELCSNCGEFVDTLDDFTGWCNSCSGISPEKVSWRIRWLVINADEIERVMVIRQVTSVVAKKIVAEANRPICLCCRKPIYRGNRRSVFCRTTPDCRIAQAVFDRNHNLPREQAIQKAMEELVIKRLLYGENAA